VVFIIHKILTTSTIFGAICSCLSLMGVTGNVGNLLYLENGHPGSVVLICSSVYVYLLSAF